MLNQLFYLITFVLLVDYGNCYYDDNFAPASSTVVVDRPPNRPLPIELEIIIKELSEQNIAAVRGLIYDSVILTNEATNLKTTLHLSNVVEDTFKTINLSTKLSQLSLNNGTEKYLISRLHSNQPKLIEEIRKSYIKITNIYNEAVNQIAGIVWESERRVNDLINSSFFAKNVNNLDELARNVVYNSENAIFEMLDRANNASRLRIKEIIGRFGW